MFNNGEEGVEGVHLGAKAGEGEVPALGKVGEMEDDVVVVVLVNVEDALLSVVLVGDVAHEMEDEGDELGEGGVEVVLLAFAGDLTTTDGPKDEAEELVDEGRVDAVAAFVADADEVVHGLFRVDKEEVAKGDPVEARIRHVVARAKHGEEGKGLGARRTEEVVLDESEAEARIVARKRFRVFVVVMKVDRDRLNVEDAVFAEVGHLLLEGLVLEEFGRDLPDGSRGDGNGVVNLLLRIRRRGGGRISGRVVLLLGCGGTKRRRGRISGSFGCGGTRRRGRRGGKNKVPIKGSRGGRVDG